MGPTYTKVLSTERSRNLIQTLKKNSKSSDHVAKTSGIELTLSGFDSGFQFKNRTGPGLYVLGTIPVPGDWKHCASINWREKKKPAFLSAGPVTCHMFTGLWLGQTTIPETMTVAKEKQGSDWPSPSSLPTFDHITCHPYPKHWSEPARGHALTQRTREHAEDDQGCFSLHFFNFCMVLFQILYLTPTSVSLCLDVNGMASVLTVKGIGKSGWSTKCHLPGHHYR